MTSSGTPPTDTLVALVADATGLVGRSLVERLCAATRVSRVVVLARRPLDVAHPRLDARQVEFSRLDQEAFRRADVAFCAIGTTIAAAGSQDAFRRVDFDVTLAFARFALRAGTRRFMLVSSVVP